MRRLRFPCVRIAPKAPTWVHAALESSQTISDGPGMFPDNFQAAPDGFLTAPDGPDGSGRPQMARGCPDDLRQLLAAFRGPVRSVQRQAVLHGSRLFVQLETGLCGSQQVCMAPSTHVRLHTTLYGSRQLCAAPDVWLQMVTYSSRHVCMAPDILRRSRELWTAPDSLGRLQTALDSSLGQIACPMRLSKSHPSPKQCFSIQIACRFSLAGPN